MGPERRVVGQSRALALAAAFPVRRRRAGRLLFTDGGAGLLVGANPERNVVFIADPTRGGDARIAADELRLQQVWSGEAVLMRPERSQSAADAPFSLAWLALLVLQEKALLREIGLASLTLSFLTIFPPLVSCRPWTRCRPIKAIRRSACSP